MHEIPTDPITHVAPETNEADKRLPMEAISDQQCEMFRAALAKLPSPRSAETTPSSPTPYQRVDRVLGLDAPAFVANVSDRSETTHVILERAHPMWNDPEPSKGSTLCGLHGVEGNPISNTVTPLRELTCGRCRKVIKRLRLEDTA